MILQKIEIEQFGGLKDYVLELSEGAWYLHGENEVGKSTLCAFIAAMFYGLPAKVRGAGVKGDSRNLYMPWGENYMAGNLYFKADGQEYVLSRRFGQTAKGDRCSLRSATDWQEIPIDKDEIGRRFLGVGEDAFRKTLFISQLGAAFEKGKEDELMERLSNLEHTGDEDASLQVALRELERARYELVSKTGRGGTLTQLEAEIETLNHELSEAKQRHLSFQSLLAEIQTKTAEKESTEQELVKLDSERVRAAAYAAYLQREKERKSAEELAKQLKQEQDALSSAEETLTQLSSRQANYEPILSLEADSVLRLAEKEAACTNLTKRLEERDQVQQEISELKNQMESMMCLQKGKYHLLGGILGAALLVIAIVLGIFVSPFLFALAILAPVAFFAMQRSNANQTESLTLRARIEEKQGVLERLTAENIEESLSKLQKELFEVLTKTHTQSLNELAEKAEEAKTILHRKEATEQEICRLKERVAALEQSLQAQPTTEETPITYEGLPLEALDELREKLRASQMERERLLAQLNAKAETGFSGVRSISVIESEIAQKKERHGELSQTYRAITLAQTALEQCAEELKNNFAPALNEQSGALVSALTGGRYREVKVTDSYQMMLKTGTGSEIVPSEYVSAGTFDLLYFALRLAVLRTLYDEIPLLILDDTFIQLDSQRQQAAFATLQSENVGQVIYFSCHQPPSAWQQNHIKELKNTIHHTGL